MMNNIKRVSHQKKTNMKIKIFLLTFSIFTCAQLWITETTTFEIKNELSLFLAIFVGFISIMFFIFIIKMIKTKRIKYNLNSKKAYGPLLGLVLLFYILSYAAIAYPIPYLVHINMNNSYQSKMEITYISKTTAKGDLFFDDYHLILKNNDFKSTIYFDSKSLYEKLKPEDIVQVYGYESIFGYSVEKIDY